MDIISHYNMDIASLYYIGLLYEAIGVELPEFKYIETAEERSQKIMEIRESIKSLTPKALSESLKQNP